MPPFFMKQKLLKLSINGGIRIVIIQVLFCMKYVKKY